MYKANQFLSRQQSLTIPAPHIVTLLFETPQLPFYRGRTLFVASKLVQELSKAGDGTYGLSVCGRSNM
jgi:hypothetical protein